MAAPGPLVGLARPAMLIVAGAVGIGSVVVARRSPAFSLAGTSGWAAALELAAGWALVGAGLVATRTAARGWFGGLLTVAGLTWFIVGWNNPGVGSAPIFTVGLVVSTVCPVLVAHAGLRYPDRRLGGLDTLAVGAGYVGTVGIGGLLAALLFDPAASGCSRCPVNLLFLGAAPGSAPAMTLMATRAAIYLAVLWSVLSIGVLGRRLVRSTPARRPILAAVLVPAMAYLTVVCLEYLHSGGRGFLGADPIDRGLWTVQGLLLVLLALGTGGAFVRTRLTRTAVARLVVQAAEVRAPGGLGPSLGALLGDPTVRVLYPLGDGRLADPAGRSVDAEPGRATTRLTRGATTVAVLEHAPGLLDAPGAAEDIAVTARLALDNERLQAERSAQLADLQASRTRLVAASDAERRRLERDLHDGAQQQLVALALGLRLATLRGRDAAVVVRLDEAQVEVTAALAELRAVARGLYPRELADEGLTAGLETLVESLPMTVHLVAPVDERYPQAVEAAAYFAVAHCTTGAPVDQVSVSVSHAAGLVSVEIATDNPPCLVELEDRVGALAGRVTAVPTGTGGTRVLVELPCAC